MTASTGEWSVDRELLEKEYRESFRLTTERSSGRVGPSVAGFLLFARHLVTYELILPYVNGREVLEVGCNLGYGSRFLAASGFEVTAIDNDIEVIEEARRCSSPGIRFTEADAARLPFEERSFDTVIGLQILEHLTPLDADRFLEDCARVLRPGGNLILVTPNRRFRMMPGQRAVNPEHTREFTQRQVASLVGAHFGEVKTMGTRSTEFIEETEHRRMGRSVWKAYVAGPGGTFLRKHAPGLKPGPKCAAFTQDLDLFFEQAPTVETSDFRLVERAGTRAM